MSTTILKKVQALEKKRLELTENLFAIEEMVQGSFCLIHVKCGKKYCRCNSGELHPHYRMSMKKEGRQLSRAVPKEDYEWITRLTDNYKKYRKIRRMRNDLEEKIKKLLNSHEKKLIKKSSKKKRYLDC